MRWIVLVQVSSLAQLRAMRPSLEVLLQLPGIAGFSLRVPAKVLNPSPHDWSGLALFDEAIAIALAVEATRHPCEVQFRTMYGRWAPRHAAERWAHYPGGNLGGTDWALAPFDYPVPFTTSGDIPWDFVAWIKRAQRKVVRKSLEARVRGLRCDVAHMSHTAGTWAEVFVIAEMAALAGYDIETILELYTLVMASADAAFDGQAEFALSGHVYPAAIRGPVFAALSSVARNAGGGILINRNDIRNGTKFDAMPTSYPLGWQSYASDTMYRETIAGVPSRLVAYDWPLIRREAIERKAVYYEAYPANFGRTTRVPGATLPESYVPLERVVAEDAA